LIVGKIGITPDYFLNRLSIDEANLLIEAHNEIYKESWEKVRMSSFNKIKLPWDDKIKKSDRKPTEAKFNRLKNWNK